MSYGYPLGLPIPTGVPLRPKSPLWADRPPVVALTVRQPWAWSICYAGKRVENRGWRPRRQQVPFTIAIHAGARPKGRDHLDMEKQILRLVDYDLHIPKTWWETPDSSRPRVPEDGLNHFDWSAIVAVATIIGFYADDDPPQITSPDKYWYLGPVGWKLQDVYALPEPVACRGSQSLWSMDPQTRAAVHKQLSG